MSNVARGINANRIAGLIVVVLAVLTYLPAIRNDFVDWDDPTYVTKNPHVAAGLTANSIVYALTTFDCGNWIPLTWLSYELDATLFGLNPAPFHAVNLFWHALNSWLLFHVLKCFTGSVYRSAAVAILFAVHPLHVESVAWISERKDLLSTCALLLSLLAYHRYATGPTRFRFAVVGCMMTLGLLAKSMLVTLPVLLCLVDFWPLQRVAFHVAPDQAKASFLRSPWQLLIEKIPLLLLALADGLITISAQWTAMPGGSILPFPTRLANATVACCWYLWKTIWPTGLCAYYRYQLKTLSPLTVGASASLLAALTVYVVLRGRRHKHLVFGWFWFVIALLPVLGLLQVGIHARADRYTYVPHIGLLTLIVWELHRVLQRSSAGKWVGIGLVTIGTGGCMLLTNIQIQTWRNTETLWTRAIELDRYNPIAHFQLGETALRRNDPSAAIEHYSNVFVHFPASPEAILNLGIIHQQQKEWDLAAHYYTWLFRLIPNHPVGTYKMGQLPPRPAKALVDPLPIVMEKTRFAARLLRSGDLEGAVGKFREAAEADPKDAMAQINAARSLEDWNHPELARQYYERALVASPGEVEAIHGRDRINKLREIQ